MRMLLLSTLSRSVCEVACHQWKSKTVTKFRGPDIFGEILYPKLWYYPILPEAKSCESSRNLNFMGFQLVALRSLYSESAPFNLLHLGGCHTVDVLRTAVRRRYCIFPTRLCCRNSNSRLSPYISGPFLHICGLTVNTTYWLHNYLSCQSLLNHASRTRLHTESFVDQRAYDLHDSLSGFVVYRVIR
jgi:hypothetical protein